MRQPNSTQWCVSWAPGLMVRPTVPVWALRKGTTVCIPPHPPFPTKRLDAPTAPTLVSVTGVLVVGITAGVSICSQCYYLQPSVDLHPRGQPTRQSESRAHGPRLEGRASQSPRSKAVTTPVRVASQWPVGILAMRSPPQAAPGLRWTRCGSARTLRRNRL